MFCGKCGNKLNKNSKFCGKCGHETKKETQEVSVQKQTEVLIDKKNNSTKFCGNCGNKLNKTSKFCGVCGHGQTSPKTKNVEVKVEEVKENKPKEKKESKIFNNIKKTIENIKNFIVKHKVILSISLALIILIAVGIFLFFRFYDFTKMSWDQKYGDYNVTHTEYTTLSLKVKAFDRDDQLIRKIKFEVDGGKVESKGSIVEWELPKKAGTYTITAQAPSGKKITKTVTVVELKETKNLLGVIDEEEYDESADSDADGLINKEEKELGTDEYLQDTDLDGLNDYYEINVSKTDPLKADSDADGLNDGNELDLELDPLKESTYDDDILDGERELTYNVTNTNAALEIIGKGNIASATIDIFENETLSNKEGLLDNVYFYHSDADITKAKISINYNLDVVLANDLVEDELKIYSFDDKTKELKALETTIDKDNKILSATVKDLDKYVIGNLSQDSINKKTQVLAVIDNSVSMYSEQQMIDAGYNNSTGAVGNDSEFKRLTLTNEMIDLFEGNYEFGVSEFSGDYVNLIEFNTDKSKVKESVNSMQSNWESSTTGTNIKEALSSGIEEFKDSENINYLILLTDGKNTSGNLSYSKSSIISSAKENNVRVCVIGLGNDVDSDILTDIATETGCAYYHASKDSALDEIYGLIGADINYSYVDTDNDTKTDGMVLYDSGFIVTRDGFSFENYGAKQSENGHCYGMAVFAMLNYMDSLPEELASSDRKTLFYDYDNALGYNLNNTYFDSNNNLYDYEFETDILSYYFEALPSDYRDRTEDGVWLINEEYYELFKNAGFIISNKDYPYEDDTIKEYQSVLLNTNSEDLKDNIKNDEYQLLNAIYRLFVLQTDDKIVSFQSDPDKSFEALKTDLESGKPTILVINHNHAVNAIKLIQDIENANAFKIAVYDNNYPSETRYIYITRTKYNKIQLNYTAWTNEYQYTFKYDQNGDGELEKMDVQISYPTVE